MHTMSYRHPVQKLFTFTRQYNAIWAIVKVICNAAILPVCLRARDKTSMCSIHQLYNTDVWHCSIENEKGMENMEWCKTCFSSKWKYHSNPDSNYIFIIIVFPSYVLIINVMSACIVFIGDIISSQWGTWFLLPTSAHIFWYDIRPTITS